MGVTGTYEPPVASGGGLKSVTKTITLKHGEAVYAESGLTTEQLAGLHSMVVNTSTTSYIQAGSVFYNNTSHHKFIIDSNSCYMYTGAMGSYTTGLIGKWYIGSSNYAGTINVTFYYFE